ncbi:MAG TPA: aminotransferase class V-fold PLP-dependent enzyme [Acidobacteriaceae bacterium]|jgi:glutamate/tyrosine decarboxylase-like PLP-dependent enzyme|nr:aminotransferase class V-fold PLP-dependent enzyme [Acidobacteriaceae bacterium]
MTHPTPSALGLPRATRIPLWHALIDAIESYRDTVDGLSVSPPLDAPEIRRIAESFTFAAPRNPLQVIEDLVPQLTRYQVHTPHPCYFGLFNPAPSTMSIAADALVAALNPQLAAWSHSPLASEIELHLVRSLAEKFSIPRDQADGVLTSGGAEANQTALVAALTHRWPEIHNSGLRALTEEPVFYVSAEAHHSFVKAARASGLGAHAVREIPVTDRLQMDPAALRSALERDRAAGSAPFLVVATAGTTGAGALDPLPELARIAQQHNLWFHVDAAWGGAAALVPELRPLLAGIEHADSITFDAHKFLSVSMGAGIFLTRHPDILSRSFATATAYMPKEAERMHATDPFSHSLQWSRRFIGLKLFLSLAVAGWDGYADTIRHQTAMGDRLRGRLIENGWHIVNATPLPLVCFTMDGWTLGDCQHIANAVIESGQAWISTIQVGPHQQPALRACITNYRTEPEHLETLIAAVDRERALHNTSHPINQRGKRMEAVTP